MSTANKALIQRYVEAWNAWNFAVMDKIVASDFSVRAFGRAEVKGLKSLKQLATSSRSIFPDGRFAIESIITEGDLVAIHWSWRRTHQGEYLGIAATRKQVTETGTSFYRITDGKIAEMWGDENALGLLQQLGVVPHFG